VKRAEFIYPGGEGDISAHKEHFRLERSIQTFRMVGDNEGGEERFGCCSATKKKKSMIRKGGGKEERASEARRINRRGELHANFFYLSWLILTNGKQEEILLDHAEPRTSLSSNEKSRGGEV